VPDDCEVPCLILAPLDAAKCGEAAGGFEIRGTPQMPQILDVSVFDNALFSYIRLRVTRGR